MALQVVFRADAGPEIGSGHVMRCLSLAAQLKALGADCLFLCRAEGLGGLADRIGQEGHRLRTLPDVPLDRCAASELADPLAHAGWLPGGQAQDALSCQQVLASLPVVDWIVVDHYALDHRWQTALRPLCRHLLAIDDLADRRHDCDLLLDQNYIPAGATRYRGLTPDRTRLLIGPRHALLREEFTGDPPPPPQTRSRLLLMFGGADAVDLTGTTVRALAACGWSEPVDVVAGPLYPYLHRLRAAVSALPAAILHAPARSVASLMRQARVAAGSPGGASWERCACAVPSVTVAQADNQELIGAGLAEAGAHLYLGRAEALSAEAMVEQITALWSDDRCLARMAAAAQALCDGRGSMRVAAEMVGWNERNNPVFG